METPTIRSFLKHAATKTRTSPNMEYGLLAVVETDPKWRIYLWCSFCNLDYTFAR